MATKTDRALTRGERANLVMRATLGDMKLKTALLVLDQFSGQRDYCWPKLATIASSMCCSERTARYAISRLKKMGILEYSDENRGRPSRVYSIDYERLLEFQPYVKNLKFRAAESAALQNLQARAANGAAQGCKPCTPRPAESAPITNKQVTSSATPTEQAAAASGGSKSASQGPVCLLKPENDENVKRAAQLVRAKLKAAELLTGNLVWSKEVDLLLALAENEDGNPLPRVMEVIEMADLAKPKLRGAWIKEAIEKRWKPRASRRGATA